MEFCYWSAINLKNDLLLVKDKYRETVLHVTSQCDYEEILEKVEG